MNFAFVTILLLLISLPGYVLRRSYFTARFSIRFIPLNIVNELIWSFFPAILIHGIAILIIEKNFNLFIHLKYIGYLLTGGSNSNVTDLIFENIHSNLSNILIYFISLLAFVILLGNLSRIVVRKLSLDIYFPALRFPNTWHYLFTGEYLDIETKPGAHKDIDFIFVDVLMNIGEGNVIYSGILENYYLSKKSGGLERIIIKYPSKKTFSTKGDTEDRDIPGNYLIIPYDKINNMNVQYYDLMEEENNSENVETAPEFAEE
ncbi:MAG: hypothetical protein KGY70_20145 [Bacteroidales bacterium]|nr:hypothetical protein [Bacteroidales bacterium]MBS3777515.1 hypothetical protein [Bacteroidales bacterium]